MPYKYQFGLHDCAPARAGISRQQPSISKIESSRDLEDWLWWRGSAARAEADRECLGAHEKGKRFKILCEAKTELRTIAEAEQPKTCTVGSDQLARSFRIVKNSISWPMAFSCKD